MCAMKAKEVAGKFQSRWGKYLYQYRWDSYTDISHDMSMYCPVHGDFILEPIAHIRREPCPQCQTVIYAKEAISKNWITSKELAVQFECTEEEVLIAVANI